MNNIEIENCLRNNMVTKKKFRGIYPCDQLKKTLNSAFSFIVINFCSSDTSGCHWVALGLSNNKKSLFYFDSSGLPSFKLNRHILKYCKKHKKRIFFNNIPIQSSKSVLCGKFVLAFAYFFCKGLKKKFMSLFDKNNLYKNDHIVNDIYKKLYK